jgi:hypothetical protein
MKDAAMTDLEKQLAALLNDPGKATVQVDLARAVALRNQERLLRQRVGAATARVRRAKEADAPEADIRDAEARVAQRQSRLDATSKAANTADIRRPAPEEGRAQIFGRVIGSPEKPPLTAALLSPDDTMVACATADAMDVFHIVTDSPIEAARLVVSDKSRRVLYRSPGPLTVEAGAILQIEVTLGAPEPAPCKAPGGPAMPDLVGQSERVALVLLDRLGFKARIKAARSKGVPDLVIAQSPDAGADLTEATKIVLTVRRAVPTRGDASGAEAA